MCIDFVSQGESNVDESVVVDAGTSVSSVYIIAGKEDVHGFDPESDGASDVKLEVTTDVKIRAEFILRHGDRFYVRCISACTLRILDIAFVPCATPTGDELHSNESLFGTGRETTEEVNREVDACFVHHTVEEYICVARSAGNTVHIEHIVDADADEWSECIFDSKSDSRGVDGMFHLGVEVSVVRVKTGIEANGPIREEG